MGLCQVNGNAMLDQERNLRRFQLSKCYVAALAVLQDSSASTGTALVGMPFGCIIMQLF